MAQRLDDVVFTWDPDVMDIPESKKTVSTVATYTGSAIFQWGEFIEGTEIILKWDLMGIQQYNDLRAKYISTDTFEWNPDLSGESFNVKVMDMYGEYIKVLQDDIEYRQNVVMTLSIRTKASTTTTTTTTTSSTTSTTSSTTTTTPPP